MIIILMVEQSPRRKITNLFLWLGLMIMATTQPLWQEASTPAYPSTKMILVMKDFILSTLLPRRGVTRQTFTLDLRLIGQWLAQLSNPNYSHSFLVVLMNMVHL